MRSRSIILSRRQASANLARFDGIRYGLREGERSGYAKTRAAGLGAEVKRRIILGTYVLIAGIMTHITSGLSKSKN